MKIAFPDFGGLVALATCLTLTGCSSDLYPGRSGLASFVKEESAQLNALADQIEAEKDIREVWCIPPATIEVRTHLAPEPRSSSKLEFDAYNKFCMDLHPKGLEGVVASKTGTALVFMLAAHDARYFRVDLVRLADKAPPTTTCGWLIYFEDDATCDIEASQNWVIRYTWNSENNPTLLYD